ncbi:hypothetical protein INR49_032841, partial [Caranx melampygus]
MRVSGSRITVAAARRYRIVPSTPTPPSLKLEVWWRNEAGETTQTQGPSVAAAAVGFGKQGFQCQDYQSLHLWFADWSSSNMEELPGAPVDVKLSARCRPGSSSLPSLLWFAAGACRVPALTT